MNDSKVLDKVIKEFMDIAFRDKVITDDEFAIIQQAEFDIESYLEAINKAKEDGIITLEERRELEKLKTEIVENAKKVANEDGIIDQEEIDILRKLSEIIKIYLTD